MLIYWFTSNLWTMGQQFYVIRRNPAPGTPAYDAWEARRRARTEGQAGRTRARRSRAGYRQRGPAIGARTRRGWRGGCGDATGG